MVFETFVLRPFLRGYKPFREEFHEVLEFRAHIDREMDQFIAGGVDEKATRLILRDLRVQLQTGDALLLGTVTVKDEATLLAAYDDSDGITAAFNLNILHRLNRELRANFDTAHFRHRVLWNSIESRIEMHLESTQEQDVCIADMDFDLHIMPHETIHTENSYKFTDYGLRSLLNFCWFCGHRDMEGQSRLVRADACVSTIVFATMQSSRSKAAGHAVFHFLICR